MALARGDTQLAFQHFARARERDPRFSPAHMNQGSVLLKAGDFAAAERAYRAALAVDGKARSSAIGLAIALRGQGKHKEARAPYERCSNTSQPTSPRSTTWPSCTPTSWTSARRPYRYSSATLARARCVTPIAGAPSATSGHPHGESGTPP